MVIYKTRRAKEIIERLRKDNVQAVQYYRPIATNPVYKSRTKFPIAEKVFAHYVYLPSSLGLKSSEIRKICKAIVEVEKGTR
jgi:dTDP-4-amino-4,6-dideoxygalactose transaminase